MVREKASRINYNCANTCVNNLATSKECAIFKSAGFNKAVISFNGFNPTYLFNGKDASKEYEKIKSKASKEIVSFLLSKDEPIDMYIAKTFLEILTTAVFNFRNEVIKYTTYGAEKHELPHLLCDAGNIDEFLRIFNSYTRTNVNCIYKGKLYPQYEYSVRIANGLLNTKSLKELLGNIDLIIRNIVLACQNAYVYNDQPNFDEYAEYCSFILGCINYMPLAA